MIERTDSLGLDAGIVDHLAPHLDLLLDPREELLGRAAGGQRAVVLESLPDLRRLQGERHFAVDAVHDRARQALGTGEAIPDDDFVVRQSGLGDGRNLGGGCNAPAVVTAMARSLPDLTCGSAVEMPLKYKSVWPAIVSVSAGPVPL